MLFFIIFMKENRYNQRGVSADKEDVHNAIKNVDKGLFPKAFCKIIPDYLFQNQMFLFETFLADLWNYLADSYIQLSTHALYTNQTPVQDSKFSLIMMSLNTLSCL